MFLFQGTYYENAGAVIMVSKGVRKKEYLQSIYMKLEDSKTKL